MMMNDKNRFIHLPHTADIKIRAFGKNLPDLFTNALYGMFCSIVPQIKTESYISYEHLTCDTLEEKRELDVASIDLSSLLVDFLSDAWYLSDVHNEAYFDMNVKEFSETHMKTILCGSKINGFDEGEIKAVTYHDLVIKEENGLWIAEIIFDI